MLKRILILLSLWKIYVFIFALIGSLLLSLQHKSTAQVSAFGLPYFHWIWGNFDGVHYVEIARAGYHYPNYAYFPFYPFLISSLRDLSAFQAITAGLLISHASLFISLFFVYKIARLDFDKNTSWKSILFLLAFPTAFFYGAVYADALYLLLSVVSFYNARKNRWFLAGVFGYLASLTRLVGIVLLPVLLLEWYTQKQHRGKLLPYLFRQFFKERVYSLFLIPLGIITYGTYLQHNFGDFLLFQKSMQEWNQEQIIFPLQTVFRYIKIFILAQKDIIYFIASIEFIATITYLLLAMYVFLKVRMSYGLLMLLTLLIPAFTGIFQSMPRYMLHLFPGFIAIALLTRKSRKRFWITIVGFLILQGIFVALFTRGYFVA